MIGSFLITFREALEACVIIGIILSYLSVMKQETHKKNLYLGIAAGVIASIAAAYLFQAIAGGFEGQAEQIFEGTTMLIGGLLLTFTLFWMLDPKKTIEKRLDRQLNTDKKSYAVAAAGIFMLVFVSVLREGVETVLFLNAARYASGIDILGAVLGIAAAIGVGYLMFRATQLKKIFVITTILLIFFGAGLITHSIHEYEEAGIMTGIITPFYDSNSLIPQSSALGSALNGLFGYDAKPSLSEVICYWSYLAIAAVFYIGRRRHKIKKTSLRKLKHTAKV